MKPDNKPSKGRRKFIAFGLASAAFFSFFKWRSSPKKTKKVRMLTQDGKLVEINEELLSANRKKISNEELRNWVNRN
jgi:hypothetical protein